MADLSERMQRTASQRNGTAAQEPFQRAKSYPRRITLDLSQDDYDALRLASFAGDVKIAALLRGLVEVFRTETTVSEAALALARAQKT